jgi:hypothetical protein
LQRFVEFANGLLFANSFKALQAFDFRTCSFGYGISQFGLSAAWWSFEKNGFRQFGGEEYNRGGYVVDGVPNRAKGFPSVRW